jgi:PPM family protein phosphatase
LKAAGLSHPGKVRENNEDSFLIEQGIDWAIFAVADGMGGHAAGEVASKMALVSVQEFLASAGEQLVKAEASGESLRPYLLQMLRTANEIVLLAAGEKSGLNGMGTTLTLLFTLGRQNWVGHIGDSRAYHIRQGTIRTVTEDHTLVSQLAKSGQISEDEKQNHPQRHVLTQALGTDKDPVFDLRTVELLPGDRMLLCTDGLYGVVRQSELIDAAISGKPAGEIVSGLIELANERGGPDNITLILVEIP